MNGIHKPRVLVVDDEPKLVHLVREILAAAGHETLTASSGESAIEIIAVEQPDLVLLDIVLGRGMDGYAVARRVREFSDVPIIMLTAKSQDEDLLRGFDSGADDYLTKPFNAKELLARVRAVLSRTRRDASLRQEAEIVCGALTIDTARRRVRMADRELKLTPTEYSLLYQLARHRDQVMLHEQLLTAVWGNEYRDDVEYLRAYIRYLRQKIEPDPAHPQFIVTSQGVGYMLTCPPHP